MSADKCKHGIELSTICKDCDDGASLAAPAGSADALTYYEQTLILMALQLYAQEGRQAFQKDAGRLADRLTLAWSRPPNDQAHLRVSALSREQLAILDHTVHRAAQGYYCGGGKDMDALVAAGLMAYAGRKSFVPDPYYTITSAGHAALRAQNESSSPT